MDKYKIDKWSGSNSAPWEFNVVDRSLSSLKVIAKEQVLHDVERQLRPFIQGDHVLNQVETLELHFLSLTEAVRERLRRIFPNSTEADYRKIGEFRQKKIDTSLWVLQIKEGKTVQVIKLDRKKILLYSAYSDPRYRARQLARAIRYCLTKDALSRGELLFHGSAVDVGGRAIVFLGDKSAGKTTMMLYGLERGLGYVSNDQTLIRIHDGRVLGSPISVGLRSGTLSLFPVLKAHDQDNHDGMTISERLNLSVTDRGAGHRDVRSPSSIATAFGSSLCGASKVRALIILERQPETQNAKLVRLRKTEDSVTQLIEMIEPLPFKHQPFWAPVTHPIEARSFSIRSLVSRGLVYRCLYSAESSRQVIDQVIKI